jgi:hypothetical protein
VGKSPLNYRRGMPLASLIKLCGTGDGNQVFNYKLLMINYKLLILNFQ